MAWRYRRTWSGPVRAVILDWAGTAVDHGCRAPARVFVEVLREEGVAISVERARGPMGVHKREHLRRLCALPEVSETWARVHGRPLDDADQERMYARLVELQIACLPAHAAPIPGCLEAVDALRARGVRVGSTTGYTPEMLAVLREAAAGHGYVPDCAVSAGEVPEGRPAPFLCFAAAMRLGVWPVEACVKVGDTPVDIEAGLNAGMWTVGVALTGNLVGLTAEEWGALAAERRAELRRRAYAALHAAGAHFVIDGIGDLPVCVDEIESCLRRGERP